MKICFRFWPNTVISEGSNPPPHRAASRNGVMGDQTAMAKAQSRVRACPSVCRLLRFAAPRHSTPIVPSKSVAPTETPRVSSDAVPSRSPTEPRRGFVLHHSLGLRVFWADFPELVPPEPGRVPLPHDPLFHGFRRELDDLERSCEFRCL